MDLVVCSQLDQREIRKWRNCNWYLCHGYGSLLDQRQANRRQYLCRGTIKIDPDGFLRVLGHVNWHKQGVELWDKKSNQYEQHDLCIQFLSRFSRGFNTRLKAAYKNINKTIKQTKSYLGSKGMRMTFRTKRTIKLNDGALLKAYLQSSVFMHLLKRYIMTEPGGTLQGVNSTAEVAASSPAWWSS